MMYNDMNTGCAEEAVSTAFHFATKAMLFYKPGLPAFDLFQNYETGKQFRQIRNLCMADGGA